MNPIRLELTPEQFAALGSHTPGIRKPLSPLPAGEEVVREMDNQLVQAGLLDPNRQLKEPYANLLSILGKAEVMVDLSWTDAGDPKGFSLYSPRSLDGSNPWAPTWVAETGSGGLVLQSPFTRQDLDGELQQILGVGETSAQNIEILLTAPQAEVLAALMDEQNLQNAADTSMVLETLQGIRGPEKSRRYFLVPIQMLTKALEWTPESVQQVLNSLVRLGLCMQSGGIGYFLSEPIKKILEGSVIPGKAFWLSLRQTDGESDELQETEAEHIGFYLNGANLVFSCVNENFRLKTFSREDVAGMIAKEIFPATLSPRQPLAAPSVRIAAAPVKKKKVPTGLIAGLAGVLLIACVLMVLGLVLLLV
jgi:hypothetical protein